MPAVNYAIKNWHLLWIMTFVMGMICIPVNRVHAHKLSVFAWVEDNTVHVESKFSSGRKPKAAPIEIQDGNGNLILAGTTDSSGQFSFKVPQKTTLKIILKDGMGHRAEWTIPAEDLPGTGQDAARAENIVPSAVGHANAAPIEKSQKKPDSASGPCREVTSGQIQIAVEKALDKKLAPLVKMIAESKNSGPTVRDVLGGIGYIFGLIGVAAYVHSRKKKN